MYFSFERGAQRLEYVRGRLPLCILHEDGFPISLYSRVTQPGSSSFVLDEGARGRPCTEMRQTVLPIHGVLFLCQLATFNL